MAANTTLNPGTGGDTIAAEDDGTAKHQKVKVEFGGAGVQTLVSAATPLPVSNPTQAANGAAVPAVFDVVAGSDGTNARSLKTDTAGVLQVGVASPLPAGTNTVGKVDQGVAGASAWKVDGSATTQPVSGTVTANIGTAPGLTDTQLRASAVPVDTELPAAAALADAAANPTAPAVAAFGMVWNGATWDRAPGTAAGGITQTPRADAVTAGTITANGQAVTATITAGMSGWAAYFYGTYATGATLVWEVSPDGGTTWMGLNATAIGLNQATPVTQIALGANATACYSGDLPPGTTNIRVRCSVWAAPTGTINVRLSQSTSQHVLGYGGVSVSSISTGVTPGNAAAQLGKAEDASAVTGDTGVFTLGVRNDTQASPVNADGDYTQFSVDARGALRVNPAAFTYSHISTATTTTVKSGAGELHSISVNTKGTVASTITVFDNTAGSGTVIGVIDSLNLSGAFVLDVAFTTGLTIVTTGTVAPDLTVSFR